MSTPMPVTYTVRHHDHKPCERIPQVPDGFETVHWQDARPGDLAVPTKLDYKEWVEITPRGAGHPDLTVIRRKPTITLEVGAWYELSHHGGVHQCRPALGANVCNAYDLGGNTYDHNGQPVFTAGSRPRILRRVWVYDAPFTCALGKMECGKHNRPLVFDDHAWHCPTCVQLVALDKQDRERAPQPFRLSGPGWYRSAEGHWFRVQDHAIPRWQTTGKSNRWDLPDLIARATPEQERILEGL